MIDNWNFLSAHFAGVPGLVLSGSVFTLVLVALLLHARKRRKRQAAPDALAFHLLQAIRGQAIFALSPQGRIESWSPSAEALFGMTWEAVRGQPFARLIGETLAARLLADAEAEGRQESSHKLDGPDGAPRHVSISIDLVRDAVGVRSGFAVAMRDDTKAQDAAARREAFDGLCRLAVDNLPLGIAVFDKDERLAFHNPALRQMMRLPQVLAETGPHFRETLFFALGRLLQPREELQDEVDDVYRRYRENVMLPGGGELIETFGEEQSVLIRTSMLEEGGFVLALEDISDRLRPERSIAYVARHDLVTGLPNRAEYEDYLEDALDRARRKGERLSLLSVELGRFRAITAAFGPEEADALLRRFSARLAASLSQGEFIARTDRDRLTLLKAYAQPAELEAFVTRLRHVLGQRFDYRGQSLSIPVRLDLQSVDTRIKAPDSALDQAVSKLQLAARTLAESQSAVAAEETVQDSAERAIS